MSDRIGTIKGPETGKSGISFGRDLGMPRMRERTGMKTPKILNIRKLIMRGYTRRPTTPETTRPETSAGAFY